MADRVSSGDDPFTGLVLDRQFRLDALIGTGAMARVYRAHQLGVGRDVAVKVLRPELHDRAEIVERFRSEAEIAARLVHPNVVAVHAVGQFESPAQPGGWLPYVVLEWLDGRSLADELTREGGHLPLARTLHVMLCLADAVGEAHALGVVHRDLKPENVMLVRRGDDSDFVKLLDFGLAKTLDTTANPRTRAGSILGTPRYVSPEGAQGLAVTPASDCYSLATLLFQCLTGRTPFDAPNAVTLLSLQATAAAPDVRGFEPTRALAEPLAREIMRNLEKRPEARAVNAREFGRALVDAARAANLDAREFGLSSTLLGSRRAPAVGVDTLSAAPPAARESGVTVMAPAAVAAPPAPSREAPRLLRLLALVLACFAAGVLAAVLMAQRTTPLQPHAPGAPP